MFHYIIFQTKKMINKKTSPGNFEFAELFAVVNMFVKQNSLPLIIQKADNSQMVCEGRPFTFFNSAISH